MDHTAPVIVEIDETEPRRFRFTIDLMEIDGNCGLDMYKASPLQVWATKLTPILTEQQNASAYVVIYSGQRDDYNYLSKAASHPAFTYRYKPDMAESEWRRIVKRLADSGHPTAKEMLGQASAAAVIPKPAPSPAAAPVEAESRESFIRRMSQL